MKMKPLLWIIAAAALALSACAPLAGFSLAFGEDGTATFQTPPQVVILPAK